MIRRWIGISLALLFAQLAFAQGNLPHSIGGYVYDSLNRQPLSGATVTLMQEEDSTTIAFSTAGKEGKFQLQKLPTGVFSLLISFTGYRQFAKKVQLLKNELTVNLDTIYLLPDTNTLEGVVISRPPVSVKGDTVEFRASAFKTPPNATAEDLMKKLPGVEVDKDGNITAQGEEITRIYVDGKEFFSNDPKLATKNLNAEMIESIQVFDDMSEQAKFTRIDDGSRTRTINIKLKKDRKKGLFGRATLGAGSSDRYTGSISANTFNDDRQLSVLGGGNNINRMGFTQNDLDQSLSGNNNRNRGNQRTGNGPAAGDGNTETWNAGINYRDNWGTKATVGASYFTSNTQLSSLGNSYRQIFFPNDSASYVTQRSQRNNNNTSHNLNLRLEYSIDSMNSLLITPNLRLGKTESLTLDSSLTEADGKFDPYLAIIGVNRRLNENENLSFGNNLLYRRRFQKAGRTLTIGWNTNINNNEADGLNESPYVFFNPDSSIKNARNVQQKNYTGVNSFNNTISTSMTEMVAAGKFVEVNYAWNANRSTSNRETWDFNPASGKYDSVNPQLTNYFENTFLSSRLGANFRTKKQQYDYQVGGAVQWASLENMSRPGTTGKDSTMRQNYVNFFPNASFNYNLGTRQSLRFQYRGNTRAPSVSQLQNVVDISNPLRWRSGNPALDQEFTNNFNLALNTMNMKTFMYFNASIQASITSNKIVNSIDTVSSTIQISRPENVNGARQVAFSATLGIPLKKVTTGRRSPMNLNLTMQARRNRDVSLLYKEVNFNLTSTISQRVSFNYNIDRRLDLNATAMLSYSDTRYTVQNNLNNNYFNHRYSLDGTAWFFKRLSVNNDFGVTINGGMAEGYNQPITMWNASAGWLLFKKSNGELRLSVIDILNQNKSINRNSGDNFIEDSYVNVLRRYFMVSFMLNLNRFGGKPVPAGNRNNQRMGAPANNRL